MRLARRPSPSSRVGRTTPPQAWHCRTGGLYLLSPHPEPLLYRDPPSLPNPSPVPVLKLRRCGRRLRPRRFRLALALFPPAPPADFSAAAPLAPLPDSLLPSLYLAPEAATATGAVRRTPTPRLRYFPPPQSRESCAAASGSSREIYHHGSGCSRGSRVLELNPGRGPMWGLESAGGGGESQGIGVNQWGLK